MTAFPTTLDTFDNPTPFDNLNDAVVPHDEQHTNLNDAMEAVQAKIGIDASADTDSLDYRLGVLEGTSGSGHTFKMTGGHGYIKHPVTGLWHKLVPVLAEDGSIGLGVDQTAS